jgi:hypothetical protein
VIVLAEIALQVTTVGAHRNDVFPRIKMIKRFFFNRIKRVARYDAVGGQGYLFAGVLSYTAHSGVTTRYEA